MYSKEKYENTKHEQKIFNTKNVSNENGESSLELEDPCAPKKVEIIPPMIMKTPGNDPRFQQQNQTLRCYVMYADFHNCEHLLGEGNKACTWFQEVYKSICPNAWIEQWDEYRNENRMPWHKRTPFAEAPYGK